MAENRRTIKGAPNRVDALSVLRLFAWFLVFETHVLINAGMPILDLQAPNRAQIWPLLTPAWAGVWIFFILSGYLMGKAYLAGRYDLSKDGIKAFYFNRFIRVAPLYFFALLVVSVFVHPEVFKFSNWLVMLPALTFTYNGQQPINVIGALWYVSTLMQLYLVTPLFFFAVRKRFADRRFAGGMLCVLVVAGVLIRLVPLFLWRETNPITHWYSWVYAPSWSNLDLFFGGFLLASLTSGFSRRPVAMIRALSVIVLLALTLTTSYVYDKGMNMGLAPLDFVFVYLMPTAWFAVTAIVVSAFDRGPRTEPLSRSSIRRNPLRALELVALLTFGMYVWHEPILGRIAPISTGSSPWIAFGATWVLGFVLSVTLAAITYVTIERPCARWKL